MDENDTSDKPIIKAVKQNDVAIAQLTMAFETEALMSIITKTETDEWPSGKAHEVMEELDEQYNPKDRISRVEMRRRLNKVQMGKRENPTTLFDQLAIIARCYDKPSKNQKLAEDDMIAVVLDKAPKEYTQTLAVEEQIQGESLVLKELKKAMKNQFRILYGSEEKSGSRDAEITLSAFQGKKFPLW